MQRYDFSKQCDIMLAHFVLCTCGPTRKSRYRARWLLRHAPFTDNYTLSQNKTFPLVKCIRRYA